MTRKALVVGLGLIGGSAAIALSRRGWRVRYIDPHVAPEEALAAGAASERASAAEDDEIVVLATPADVAAGLLPAFRGAVTTSVCSVMATLRRAAGDRPFVAGHPMAGSHERGLGAARSDLFEGRKWFVDAEHPLVDQLVHDCGAERHLVNAEHHDAAVALTSHLPQILSTALAASLDEESWTFSGTGLRTFLRLAESDPSVWRPVIEANRENIERALEDVMVIVQAILDGDDQAFEKAQKILKIED